MKGVMLIFRPDCVCAAIRPVTRVPSLEALQELIDGPLELIPGFGIVRYGDRDQPCTAYSNEEPPRRARLNLGATEAWAYALRSVNMPHPEVMIRGSVVVLFGDDEFMSEL